MSCEGQPIPSMHVGKAIADKWVKNYRNNKKEALAPTAGPKGDTNTLWYSVEQMKGLISEAECQGATGIRLYFAAYSEVPTVPGEAVRIPAGANKGLTVVYVLTKQDPATGVQQDFFIEDQAGFDQRESTSGKSGEGDFDTGNPSPPAPPPGEELPLP